MPFPTQDHIDAAETAASNVLTKTGFYCWPSVTLAQGLVESAGWTKLAGENNGFGIKATPAQIADGECTYLKTREVINGQDKVVTAAFADFPTLADAYEAHAMLFVRIKLYAAALKATTARQFVVDMGPHYASDPSYAKVIIGVMDRLNLYKYDDPHHVLASPPPLQPPANKIAKAHAPAAAGGAVVIAGGVAAAAHGGHTILIAAGFVALVAGLIAVVRYVQAHQAIAAIPPKPVTPSPPAATISK